MPHRQGDDALERPAPPAVDAASRPVRRGATQQLPTVVDVVFLYTPHAARQAGGARNLRQHAVELADRMNRALADTRVEASIDVVDAQLATHYRSQVPEDVDVALRRVQNPKDRSVGAQAAKLRKQHSADLVALIVDDVAGDGVGGGLADTPDAPGRNTRHQAFSASGIDGAADETTSHEIGHNFGLDHERSPLGQGTPSKKHPTRTGSVTRDKRGYTIMAYLDDRVCVVDDDCTRIHRFADRIHTWRGQPIGDKDNDQRMVLRDTAPILAAYGTPQRPVLRHALKLSQSPGGTAWPAMWGPYRPGKQITVTAFPEPGYELAGWTFDGHRQKGTNTNFQVPMDRARSLRAHFRLSGATPLR
ncbi:M12 family metallo-peptidase [Streptomyces sp. NBC_01304]|uniref:M12 family metallo-peptidase n=1 Tax=Streptomyces sp. NBC_01304 TaxID=2903818 RepID=UPI002E0DBF50|nr:M12 family metallo-peptidase [Streptomyces sp. NBC_01304]